MLCAETFRADSKDGHQKRAEKLGMLAVQGPLPRTTHNMFHEASLASLREHPMGGFLCFPRVTDISDSRIYIMDTLE
jgi:predicted component of type VI protein secretion system